MDPANNRINPLLDLSSSIKDPEDPKKVNQIARITQAVLPFLSLYQPTAVVAAVGVGIGRSVSIVYNLSAAYKKRDAACFAKELFQLALVTATVALTVLGPLLKINPLFNLALTQGYQLVVDIHTLACSLRDHKWEEAARAALSITASLIYIASVLYAAPELIALSMLAQAALEIYKACLEFSKKDADWLMIASNLLMAMVRVYQATPHLKTTHRNWLGKQLTQSDWKELHAEILEFKKNHPEKLVDFEALLIKHYYSNYIKNINFNETGEVSKVTFKDISFKACQFSNVKWFNNIFQSVSFNSCVFSRSRMINSFFQNTSFWFCNAKEAEFNGSFFDRVLFANTNFSGAHFNESSMFRVTFLASQLFETNFFRANIHDSTIIGSDLTDTLFLGNKDRFTYVLSSHKITRPVTSLAWNFETPQAFAKIICESLKEQNMIVMKYDYTPDDIDPVLLESEVKTALANYVEGSSLSRTQTLFQDIQPGSQIEKAMQIAEEILPYVDGMVLPGGADIEPEFYGKVADVKTNPHLDKRRSVLDFALIELASLLKVPTLAICRGAQEINVHFGGTLKQHVDNHYNASHWIKNTSRSQSIGAQMMKDVLGSGMVGVSMHHQSMDQMGNHLEIIAHADGVPKVVVSQDGLFVASQIHPEISIRPEYKNLHYYYRGINFFKNFFDRAVVYKTSKTFKVG